MKLLYLCFTYRSQFRRIFADGIEFNFDSEIRFKLDGGELKRIDSVGKLPKGFFSVLSENRTSPVVDSISVIAGGNGAGKTSVVEVLLDIKEALNTPQMSKLKKFIVVHYSPNLIHLTPRSSLIGHPARKSHMRPHRVGVIPFGVSFVVLQSSVLL